MQNKKNITYKSLLVRPFNFLIKLGLTVFAISLIILYYGFHNRDTTRNNALTNPVTCEGIITNDHHNYTGVKYLDYSFSVNGNTYTGETFYGSTTSNDKKICVIYNKTNPNYNISCQDKVAETFNGEVLFAALKLTGFILLGILVIILLISIFVYFEKGK